MKPLGWPDSRSRIALALSLLLAGGSALAKISECQADCETRYKSCSASGRMTEAGCRTELEKCRKACNKKEKAGGQGSS